MGNVRQTVCPPFYAHARCLNHQQIARHHLHGDNDVGTKMSENVNGEAEPQPPHQLHIRKHSI